MKEIFSTNNIPILVDDDLYDWLNTYIWEVRKSPTSTKYYASSQSLKKKYGYMISMHRLIMGLVGEDKKGEKIVDHINRNGLDNRKENLRIVTKQENGINSGIRKNNTTGYKNVSFRKDTRKYRAYIALNGKQINLGCFNTAAEAAKSHDEYISKIFPNHAYINLGEE